MDNIKFILNIIYTLYEIPIRCFYDDSTFYKPEIEMQEADPFIFDQSLREELIRRWNGTPILELENKNILYGICKSLNGMICILGPVALDTISGSELHQYKNNHGLIGFSNYKIPMGSIIKTASVLVLLHILMNQEQIDVLQIIKHIQEKAPNNNQITEKDLHNYHFQNHEENRVHNSYASEKITMAAIKNGDLDALNAFKDYNSIDRVGILAKAPHKQIEYMSVSAITLFTRAAIEGGVSPDKAYNISDLYLQKIAACQDQLELLKTVQNAQIDLCISVRDIKEKHLGIKYLEQCKRYVARHLYQPFTLDDLANTIGNNKCYLTHQFSLQEGKSLKRYIHEERIRAAQNMLKYSDQPIPVIANYLCFETQSHFGSVFKKITGTTPALYRLQNKAEGFY